MNEFYSENIIIVIEFLNIKFLIVVIIILNQLFYINRFLQNIKNL